MAIQLAYQLGSMRLVLLQPGKIDILRKIRLNVSTEDVIFALDESVWRWLNLVLHIVYLYATSHCFYPATWIVFKNFLSTSRCIKYNSYYEAYQCAKLFSKLGFFWSIIMSCEGLTEWEKRTSTSHVQWHEQSPNILIMFQWRWVQW